MPDYDCMILCCARTGKKSKHKCSECEHAVEVTSNGLVFKKEFPEMKILCPLCCFRRHGPKPSGTREEMIKNFPTDRMETWAWRN